MNSLLPPHDTEAEKALLSALLFDNTVFSDVIDVVNAQDFYEPRHQIIFSTAVKMFAQGQPVDQVLLAHQLQVDGQLVQVGGAPYLSELVMTSGAGVGSAVGYARIIRDQSLLRHLMYAGVTISEMGSKASQADVDMVIDRAQQLVLDLTRAKEKNSFHDAYSVGEETLERLQDIASGASFGLSTGFSEVDCLTHGLKPGQLIVVAGRPAMGKSTFAMDIARHVAFQEKKTALVFSLEMSRDEIMQRVFAAQTGIFLEKIMNANLTVSEWDLLRREQDKLKVASLHINDSAMLTMMQIRARAREFLRRGSSLPPLGVIVVDYLQLLTSSKKADNRVQEVAEFSRSLKLLAKELNVPVIALSQLNRAVEMRQDKRPMLSDLRESGSIEQDADEVLLIHRPEVYTPGEHVGEAQVIVAKNRNGRTGVATLTFDGQHSRFLNVYSPQV